LLALGVAIYLIATGWFRPQTSSINGAGRIVYEADATGRMRRVEKPSISSVPMPRLWKPEPREIGRQAPALSLDSRQRRQVEAIDAAWQREKAEIEGEINRLLGGRIGESPAGGRSSPSQEGGKAISLAGIQPELEAYSSLSRHYDVRRNHYWTQAEALLTPAQRTRWQALSGLSASGVTR
jgi:hypothetical protein